MIQVSCNWRLVDARNDVILVLLDPISAACDTLDHDIPIPRLHLYFGFKGTVLSWLSSYLRGRTQTVIVAPLHPHHLGTLPTVHHKDSFLDLCCLHCRYITPLQDVIATYNRLQCMFCANDTQLYITVKPSTPEILFLYQNCF